VAELGETEDPKALIPGNAVAVGATARSLRARGNELVLAGKGLKRIDTADGWSGAAADAFRAKFQGQPGKWLEAGDCFQGAAGALETYVYTLTWAQGEAGAAIKDWNAAQAATKQAQDAYAEYQQAGGTDPFTDPGESARAAARHRLNNARTQLKTAAGDAATKVKGFRDKAPDKPGFWSKVGDFFSNVGAGLENAGGHVVNGLASFGNAMIHHPGDTAAMAAGAGLMILGATGDVGGGALDVTVAGAVIGVPLNVVSTGAIVAGGGMVVAGGGDLMMHAASDDGVNPARTDYEGAGGDDYEPTDGFRGSEYSKDEYVQFVNGHTGDADPAMPRPSQAQVEEALDKATPEKLPGQNAELFRYGDVKVILNYDVPWRSTAYKIDKG